MIVQGVVKGDRYPIILFYGTEKACKRWISERDLNLFKALTICENNGKLKMTIK